MEAFQRVAPKYLEWKGGERSPCVRLTREEMVRREVSANLWGLLARAERAGDLGPELRSYLDRHALVDEDIWPGGTMKYTYEVELGETGRRHTITFYPGYRAGDNEVPPILVIEPPLLREARARQVASS